MEISMSITSSLNPTKTPTSQRLLPVRLPMPTFQKDSLTCRSKTNQSGGLSDTSMAASCIQMDWSTRDSCGVSAKVFLCQDSGNESLPLTTALQTPLVSCLAQ